jgi:pimeloyl-ACP methyl ester carboxylesterase
LYFLLLSFSKIMARAKRLIKSFYRLLFPILILVVAATAAASVWFVYKLAHPANPVYLVTPDKYGQLSSRASQVTDENWTNKDGTRGRGWLLKGSVNAPAVILLHKFGADRSYVLNLGVKLSEATNYTVLMPDQRAHGEGSLVKISTFGGRESEDVSSAIEFLRGLKTPEQAPLVGKSIGIYGVEMGAAAALYSAVTDTSINALALDSVPQDSDALLKEVFSRQFPFASSVTSKLPRLGTYLYFYEGSYKREPLCDTAKNLSNRQALLLGGLDAPVLQESTNKLAKCFPSSTKVESKTDLSPSGFGIVNASIEQSEVYDQKVIDFFRQALGE